MIYLIIYLVIGLMSGAWYTVRKVRRTSCLVVSDIADAFAICLVWPWGLIMWLYTSDHVVWRRKPPGDSS